MRSTYNNNCHVLFCYLHSFLHASFNYHTESMGCRGCQQQTSVPEQTFSTEIEFYWQKQKFYWQKQENRVLCQSLGELGATHTVHLWLVRKRVIDFLLVLIELFSPALTVEAL